MYDGTLQGYLIDIVSFINGTIIPFLFAIALLFFLVNVVRYFIVGGDDKEARAQARQLAIYGILAFVILVSIWGIVNLILAGFDLEGQYNPAFCPDYMEGWCNGAYRDSWFGQDENSFNNPNNNYSDGAAENRSINDSWFGQDDDYFGNPNNN